MHAELIPSNSAVRLYKLALELHKIKPWNHMSDRDLFGVQNPETGEIGYCCIIGELGHVFGLAAYLGTEGLEKYHKACAMTSQAQIDSEAIDLFRSMRNLSLNFVNVSYLKKEDLAVIKELNLNIESIDAYPLFISSRPGYIPWQLEDSEKVYFANVLEQSINVVKRFKDNPRMLESGKKNLYFTRIQLKAGNWSDAWMEPAAIIKKNIQVPVDEAALQYIKQTSNRTNQQWECGCLNFPEPV
ncbi:MAG: hypothetical protein AABX51_04000, partial [Nanoarchaeota archaeon]